MLVLIKHDSDWLNSVQTQQMYALKHFSTKPDQILSVKRNEINRQRLEDWAIIRVVNGMIGLAVDGDRLLMLDPGDCWLGYPGSLIDWYQDGAVTLEAWHWSSVPSKTVALVIHSFNDLLIKLFQHNTQIPPDPTPGFEFFQSGEVIIKEGEAADSVYTLVHGKAKVQVGGVQVGVAKENEILGLQAMLLHSNRTATVIADGPCSAVRVDYDKFRSLIETRSDLVFVTMETMAQQIDRANKRITDK